ncbi:hypothetical protein HanIR_Chr16g0835221 [Helianthus annuus]|nr:hypothetical protein HanIR_Chr16g0835221 [Helianthus annuus]
MTSGFSKVHCHYFRRDQADRRGSRLQLFNIHFEVKVIAIVIKRSPVNSSIPSKKEPKVERPKVSLYSS